MQALYGLTGADHRRNFFRLDSTHCNRGLNMGLVVMQGVTTPITPMLRGSFQRSLNITNSALVGRDRSRLLIDLMEKL